MSAQNEDTTMQEDALDQEEELAFGEEKLVIVRFSPLLASLVATAFVMVITGSSANLITAICYSNGCFVSN
jgi:hypothetical protein